MNRMTDLTNRTTPPATAQERMQAVHADAYTNWPTGDPICATCHNGNCPRYWRIQQRLDSQEAKRRASLPPALYDEEPW
jgi:hypothetical protein